MNNVIRELNSINDYRRRFYITVFLESNCFKLDLMALYIKKIVIEDDDLLVIYYNDSRFEFKISDDFKIYYRDETPEEELKRRIR